MKLLAVLAIFLLHNVEGLRDPKSVEYLEKKTFVPSLTELRDGESHDE